MATTHANTSTTTSKARARARARRDRIRAYVRTPGKMYHVWSHHKKYIVWKNVHTEKWECTCLARTLCKHRQRVIDREAKRIRTEGRNTDSV